MNMFIRKITGTYRCSFGEGDRFISGGVYDIAVSAPEFRDDTTGQAAISILHSVDGGPVTSLVSAPLVPDPLRRGVRTAVLDLSSSVFAVIGEDSDYILEVRLDPGTFVIRTKVRVDVAAGTSADPRDNYSASSWTVVGPAPLPADGIIRVADRTQASYTIGTLSAPVVIVPTVAGVQVHEAPYESYVRFTTSGGWPSSVVPRLSSGDVITWDRQDSTSLPAGEWVLHLRTIAGAWYGSFCAAVSSGVETDPDGARVVSAEVNS